MGGGTVYTSVCMSLCAYGALVMLFWIDNLLWV